MQRSTQIKHIQPWQKQIKYVSVRLVAVVRRPGPVLGLRLRLLLQGYLLAPVLDGRVVGVRGQQRLLPGTLVVLRNEQLALRLVLDVQHGLALDFVQGPLLRLRLHLSHVHEAIHSLLAALPLHVQLRGSCDLPLLIHRLRMRPHPQDKRSQPLSHLRLLLKLTLRGRDGIQPMRLGLLIRLALDPRLEADLGCQASQHLLLTTLLIKPLGKKFADPVRFDGQRWVLVAILGLDPRVTLRPVLFGLLAPLTNLLGREEVFKGGIGALLQANSNRPRPSGTGSSPSPMLNRCDSPDHKQLQKQLSNLTQPNNQHNIKHSIKHDIIIKYSDQDSLNMAQDRYQSYKDYISCLGNCCGCCCCTYKRVPTSTVGFKEEFGRYKDIVDAGLHYYNPITEHIRMVDMKTKVIDMRNQVIYTKDNISVDIDTSLFYRIVDPYKATYVVKDVVQSVTQMTYVTMRTICGQYVLQDLLFKREEVNQRISAFVEGLCSTWGVYVEKINLKDMRMSRVLSQNLSIVSRTKREVEASIISAHADLESAKLYREASDILDIKAAVQIRFLQALQNMNKMPSKKVTIIPLKHEYEVEFGKL